MKIALFFYKLIWNQILFTENAEFQVWWTDPRPVSIGEDSWVDERTWNMRESVIPAQQIPMKVNPPIIRGLLPSRSMVKHWRRDKGEQVISIGWRLNMSMLCFCMGKMANCYPETVFLGIAQHPVVCPLTYKSLETVVMGCIPNDTIFPL